MEFIRSLRMKHRKVVKNAENIKKETIDNETAENKAEEMRLKELMRKALRQPKKQKIQM